MAGRQVAVITGASTGIGRAIALAFGREGAAVVINYARSAKEAEAVGEAVRASGGRALVVQADVSDAAAVDRLVQRTLDAYSRIDVWVNNAGADILTGEAADLPPAERLQMLLQVDVMGTFLCCQAVVPVMQRAGGGVMLNMSWDHVVHGMAGIEAQLYAMAKGAVWSYSKSLARSVAPLVRVNTLAPGWVRTKFGQQMREESANRVAASTPLQRWGEPEDFGGLVLFLASPEARFITGQTFAVNGGTVMI